MDNRRSDNHLRASPTMHYARRAGRARIVFDGVWRASILGLLLALLSLVIWRGRIVHEVGICSRCESFSLRTRYMVGPMTVLVVEEKIANMDWAAWNASINVDNPHCMHVWQWTDASRANRLFALHRAIRNLQPVLSDLEAVVDTQGYWYDDYVIRPRSTFDGLKRVEGSQESR